MPVSGAGSIAGSVLMIVLGAVVAFVTLIGLVTSQVNSASNNQGDSANPTINYGSTQ